LAIKTLLSSEALDPSISAIMSPKTVKRKGIHLPSRSTRRHTRSFRDMEEPLHHFAELKDPRLPCTRRHLLSDIVVIAIAAILSGAEGWDDMELGRRCAW